MCKSAVTAGHTYAFVRHNGHICRTVYADMHLSNAVRSLRFSVARAARDRFVKQVPPFSHSKFARSMSSTVGHRLTACFMPSSSFASGSCDVKRWCVRRGARPARLSLSSQRQVWRGAASTTSQDRSSTEAGEIHVILGPMFAGKTTALLERIAEEEAKGMTVTLVKSSKDCRYSEELFYHQSEHSD